MALKIQNTASLVQSSSTHPVASSELSVNDLPTQIWEKIMCFLSLKELARTEHLIQREWRDLKRNDGCLDFSNSKLSDRDFYRYLYQYKHKKIVSLKIQGCTKLTQVCAAGLRTLTSLTDLDLGSSLDYDCLKAISHLPIKTLSINCYREGKYGEDPQLRLQYNRNATEINLFYLNKLPLKQLKFICGEITETVIARLHAMSLEKLDLIIKQSLNITDEVLDSLSKLPLTGLILVGSNFLITDKGLHSISQLSLTRFGMSGNDKITNEGLDYICQPYLTGLSLAYCRRLTPKGFQSLSKLSLIDLDLSGCNITDQCIPYFKPTIKYLDLTNTQIGDLGLKTLSRIPLETLILNRCHHISDKGVRFITQLSLKHLNLVSCEKLTEKSLIHVSKLNLEHYKVEDWGKPKPEHIPIFSRIKHAFSNLF
jgi:hypothetical protein